MLKLFVGLAGLVAALLLSTHSATPDAHKAVPVPFKHPTHSPGCDIQCGNSGIAQ